MTPTKAQLDKVREALDAASVGMSVVNSLYKSDTGTNSKLLVEQAIKILDTLTAQDECAVEVVTEQQALEAFSKAGYIPSNVYLLFHAIKSAFPNGIKIVKEIKS